MISVLSIPAALVALFVGLVLHFGTAAKVHDTALQIRRMTNTPDWAMETYDRCKSRQRIAAYLFAGAGVIMAAGVVAHLVFGW